MLRVELFTAAIILTILWVATFAYAITQGGQPPTGIIVTVITVATAAAWFLVWARPVRNQMKEIQGEVRHLREERDVSEAMKRIRHLRVVRQDDN